jgi:hypothetical protein
MTKYYISSLPAGTYPDENGVDQSWWLGNDSTGTGTIAAPWLTQIREVQQGLTIIF